MKESVQNVETLGSGVEKVKATSLIIPVEDHVKPVLISNDEINDVMENGEQSKAIVVSADSTHKPEEEASSADFYFEGPEKVSSLSN